MKYFSKIAFTIILSLSIFSCTKDGSPIVNNQLVDNSEVIAKIISSFDSTIQKIKTSNKLSDEKIGNIFFREAKNQGLTVKHNNTLNKNIDSYEQSSKEYKEFALELIDASSFSSKDGYLNHLTNLLENVENSNLIISEKQVLVDNILLTKAFVNWLDTLTPTNKSNVLNKTETSWWSSWGKCVAGILGGAGTGALTFGFAGAVAGTVTLPIIGTVAAGTVGAIGGAISGGLTGAALAC